MVRKTIVVFLIALLISLALPIDVRSEAGEVYLIVSPAGFEGALTWLIELKTLQGYDVRMLLTQGESAEALRTAILAIAPDYVLLVGDVDNGELSVPAFTGMDGTVTDLYYGVIDAGYLPTIPVGRLPVRNSLQVLATSLALIHYEFQDGILLSYYGPEEYPFVAETQYYVLDLADGNGETFALPETPQDVVVATINAGRAVVSYTGHGGEDWWLGLRQEELGLVQSQNAVVWSFACYTGNFGAVESFGETWLVEGKAVVFIGSSSETYWFADDVFERAMAEAYYGGVDAVWDILAAGREGILKEYGENSIMARRYFENYNLLGDPSLQIRTSNAGLLEVDFRPRVYVPLMIYQ